MPLRYTAFSGITTAPSKVDGVSGVVPAQCLSGPITGAGAIEVDNTISSALPAGTRVVLLTAVSNDQIIAFGAGTPDASSAPSLYLVAGTSLPVAMEPGWTIDTDDAA